MLITADARHLPLRDECVNCVVTSPPYWGLRNYADNPNQIGLEPTPELYIQSMRAVFAEVWRVLAPDGTVWLNLGDCYTGAYAPGPNSKATSTLNGFTDQTDQVRIAKSASASFRRDKVATGSIKHILAPGLAPKNLVGIPWRVALDLQSSGWYLRSDIIWAKPNPMPESVTDRPTRSHEYLFLLTKAERYYYDAKAIAEPASAAMLDQMEQGYDGLGLKDYEAAGVQNPSSVKARIIANARRKNEQSGDPRKVGFNDRWDAKEYEGKMRRADEQDAGRRMLLNAKAARDAGAPHDSPFGLTRNKRSVWTIPTAPYSGAHFATFPERLVEPCILAGCPIGGLVFDPFIGSGTVGAVAERTGRRWVGTDLSYQHLSTERTAQRGLRW